MTFGVSNHTASESAGAQFQFRRGSVLAAAQKVAAASGIRALALCLLIHGAVHERAARCEVTAVVPVMHALLLYPGSQ